MSDAELDLKAELESTEARLRLNTKERDVLKVTRGRVQRKRALCGSGLDLSRAAKNMVSLLYVIAGYQAAPAVAYVAHVLRRTRRDCVADETLRNDVEVTFLDSNLDEIIPILDESGSSQPRQLAEAWRWYTEWQLFSWVRSKNLTHGVAPRTGTVLISFDRLRMQAPLDFRPTPRRVYDTSSRVWARRWRLRWGARHANLRTVEGLTIEEIQQKAPTT